MHKKYLPCLLLTSVLILIAVAKAFSQEREIPKELYTASGIPDSLKENANSVVRYDETNVTVKGPGKVTIKHHSIVTILNEKGDKEGVLLLNYNKKYDVFSDIGMRVYDEKGVLIKKYHKGDMYDGAAINDETIVSDDRFLGLKHTIAAYPVTIEKEYEEDITSLVDLGTWNIQDNEQSVQYAYYHLLIDSADEFRYQDKNTSIKPQNSIANGKASYTWLVKDLKSIKLEEGAEWWQVFPRINFASKYFDFYGNRGDFSTWQSFGNWIKALNADGCSLSPEREADIRKMTDSIKTDKGKAKFLYHYMQQNMRYVSVQLGIGGLKPFPAAFVDQKKYGDCKALSNYMCALLKAVNIPSYYSIINAEANQEPADPSFPYNAFNHVILCVPFKGDTTWLECTSSTQPFGKLGPFTENRRALLITENGGKLVNTPRSAMQDNQFNSEVHLILNADGSAKADIKILSTGGYRDEYIGISAAKTDEQKEAFMNLLNIKQPSVFDLNLSSDKDNVKEVDMKLEYDKFCDIMAGDKQFYRPHAFDLVAFAVPIEEKRKTDYYFEHPMQKICVTTIDLPAGFEVETLPVNQSLKFTYGNYEVKYVYDAAKNQVISTARFNLTNQVIPAAKYTELQQYLDAVAKAQNKKLVIRRKA
jgi:hypothetical protein